MSKTLVVAGGAALAGTAGVIAGIAYKRHRRISTKCNLTKSTNDRKFVMVDLKE